MAEVTITTKTKADRYTDLEINNWKITGFSHEKIYSKKKHYFYTAKCLICEQESINTYFKFKIHGCKKCLYRNAKVQTKEKWSDAKYCSGHAIRRAYTRNELRKIKGRQALEFNITPQIVSDIFEAQKFKCALSNLDLYPFIIDPFEATKRKSPKYRYLSGKVNASIDRIDSNKGYTKENIQIVHININSMKMHLSQDIFIDMCIKVANHQQELLKC